MYMFYFQVVSVRAAVRLVQPLADLLLQPRCPDHIDELPNTRKGNESLQRQVPRQRAVRVCAEARVHAPT